MTMSLTHETEADQAIYVFPTSFAQQRLWFLDQLEPQSAAYSMSASIHLNFALDVEVLEQSLNTLIERHEILRTTFVAVDGQPMQLIASTLRLPLPVIDLSKLPGDEQETEVQRVANKEMQRPFDLSQGPLLRNCLLKLGSHQYVLLLTIHHIISDGWSMGVFYEELSSLYEAFSKGQPSPLPDLPIQYVDFALWQQEQDKNNLLADQLAYWKQQLAEVPTTLDLPLDRPHPAVPTSQGATHVVTLPPALANALKTLSRQEGITLYMTLVAAFQTLLHRYNGQDDIVIGSFASGRTQAETEPLIGFFVNTLVLRTDLSSNPSFRELLKRVREVILEAYAHQDVPFEHLVKQLQPERNLGQNPLCQVMLALDPPLPDLPSGWEPGRMVVVSDTAKFDLCLELVDRADGLTCYFEYSTDLFDEVTIARMAGHWQTLLEGIVAHPEQHLSELPLLTQVERQQLLVEWNDTTTEYPEKLCLHQLFEFQVERTPDAVAVFFEEQQLTYRELNARANQLAHHLQALGVGPDMLVGICMDRSIEMVVSLLGVLKAGGAYVPLDPTYPRERLAFMLIDAQVSVLLTQQRLLTTLHEYESQIICVDTDWQTIAQESEMNPISRVMGINLAYVIYTSGSTGKPKGVMISHKAICNHMLWMQNCFPLTITDGVLQKTPFSFDASIWEFYAPLISGARLILARPEGHRDTDYLIKTIVQYKVTILQLVPSLLRALLETEELKQCTSLRRVFCGGEVLPVSLQQLFFTQLDAHLYNLYGPTEASIDTTVWECNPEDTGYNVPVGHPIANVQLYILDAHLHLVPIGVPGELYIGGAGIARGYLNRPELTEERFIKHPFSDAPDDRLYKTGDLVSYRADGVVEFLGRLDHQVKIRGFRIELGEIETILSQHPTIRQAVVVAREDVPGNKRLVAYLVPHAARPVVIEEVRRFLQESLPDYMMPSAFVRLEALPLTPGGKVDRQALPVPDQVRLTLEETPVTPTSMLHYQLIQVWEELLNVQPIGIRDNFFYLGGHSLLATRLVDRIEQVCGKKISLATLFAGPTIEQIAHALQTEEGKHSRTPIVAVQSGGSKRPFFYLHGAWHSEAFYCFHLARHLGAEQPFYALEPYHFDGLQATPSVEDMAAAHIQSMRSVQPEGPYLLGGFCNGGLVAYEMARQLQAQGQKVDLLVLIDPAEHFFSHRLLHHIINRVGRLVQLSQEKQLEYFLRLRHMYKYIRNQRQTKDLKAFNFIDPSIQTLYPTADALRQDNLALLNWIVAGCNYLPYSGKTTLFWASEEPFGGVWKQKAMKEEMELHVIPGTHLGCLTDHVEALAEELKMCISKALAAELKESKYGENIPVSVD